MKTMSAFNQLRNAVIENCGNDQSKINECYMQARSIEELYRIDKDFDLVNPTEFMRNAYNHSLKYR